MNLSFNFFALSFSVLQDVQHLSASLHGMQLDVPQAKIAINK